jgi:cell wall-associated NlpC family hydrolase
MQGLSYMLVVLFMLGGGCQAGPEGQGGPADTAAGTGSGAGASPVRAASDASLPAPDPEDVRRFEAVMDVARKERLHERPLGEVMVAIGEQFKGRPYLAGVLDKPAEETLVCSLSGFDCVTFVETTLAMARAIRAQDYAYDTFAHNVRDTRYRGGEMDGYCSRIHYFSEWIADNQARGTVRNITQEIGGVPLDKRLDFMTTHRSSYPRFSEDDAVFACIQEMETNLADLDLYYIPEDRIASVYDRLQAGDIIATATDIEGLDVTHTGLVYDNGDGTRGFLHASTSGGVKLSPDLQRYVQGVKKHIGIIVARPVDRR